MKTLIVEDDATTRIILQQALKSYGPVHIAVNGVEAVGAVRAAWEAREPYQLICLDIVMPEMDGQSALKEIRALEWAQGLRKDQRAKIVMTTAQTDVRNFGSAFAGRCDEYLVKPIDPSALIETLRQLRLI